MAPAPSAVLPSEPVADTDELSAVTIIPDGSLELLVEVSRPDCEIVSVGISRTAGNKVPLRYDTSKVEVVVTVTIVSAEAKLVDVLFRASDSTDPAGLSTDVVEETIVGGSVIDAVSVRLGMSVVAVAVMLAGMVTEPRSSSATTVSLETGVIVVAAMLEVPSLTLMTTSGAAIVTVASALRSCWTNVALRWQSDSLVVEVGAGAPQPSASLLRMPISVVKRPSVALELGSRGDRMSGSSILILFDGLFISHDWDSAGQQNATWRQFFGISNPGMRINRM